MTGWQSYWCRQTIEALASDHIACASTACCKRRRRRNDIAGKNGHLSNIICIHYECRQILTCFACIHMLFATVCRSLLFPYSESRSSELSDLYHCTCCMVSHREHSVAKFTCVRDAQPCLQSRPDRQHGHGGGWMNMISIPSISSNWKTMNHENLLISRSFRFSSSCLQNKLYLWVALRFRLMSCIWFRRMASWQVHCGRWGCHVWPLQEPACCKLTSGATKTASPDGPVTFSTTTLVHYGPRQHVSHQNTGCLWKQTYFNISCNYPIHSCTILPGERATCHNMRLWSNSELRMLRQAVGPVDRWLFFPSSRAQSW